MHAPLLATPPRLRRIRLLALAVAITGAAMIALVAVPPGVAADRFTAGSRMTERLAADPLALRPATERSAEIARALGFPDGRRVAERIRDRFSDTVYDEITTFDDADRPVAIQRFDAARDLLMAVRLGWSNAEGSLSSSEAVARATAAIGHAGLRTSGRAAAEPDRSAHGWIVRWARVVDGAPVLGDGISVRLWSDGSVHSVTRTQSPLAPAPTHRLDETAATRAAERVVASWSSAERVAQVRSSKLAWVAGNDLFDASAPDAPSPERRLAWVVDLMPLGGLADRLRAIQLYLDAGDGGLLGGDLLE